MSLMFILMLGNCFALAATFVALKVLVRLMRVEA